MIFQDPMTSLNPVLTIGRQLREGLETHFGMNKKEATKRAAELVDRVVKVIVDGHRAEAPPAIIPRLPVLRIARLGAMEKSLVWLGGPCTFEGQLLA